MSTGERPRPSGRRQDSSSSHLSGPSLELQTSTSSRRSGVSSKGSGILKPELAGLARHTLGLLLLLLVVFLWTASNFLGSVRLSSPISYHAETNKCQESLRGQHVRQTILLNLFQHHMFHLHSSPRLHQVRASEIPGKQLSLVYPYSGIPQVYEEALHNVWRIPSLPQT